jgi:hypothetical protein
VPPFVDDTPSATVSNLRLSRPVLDPVATPSGNGCYMVVARRHLSLSAALPRGSMVGRRLNAVLSPVPEIAGTDVRARRLRSIAS